MPGRPRNPLLPPRHQRPSDAQVLFNEQGNRETPCCVAVKAGYAGGLQSHVATCTLMSHSTDGHGIQDTCMCILYIHVLYVHTYMHKSVDTYIHTYIDRYLHTHMPVYICIHNKDSVGVLSTACAKAPCPWCLREILTIAAIMARAALRCKSVPHARIL